MLRLRRLLLLLLLLMVIMMSMSSSTAEHQAAHWRQHACLKLYCLQALLRETHPSMSLAPRAQLRPTAKGLAWLMLTQKASLVWPLRVRPLMSTMVPLTSTGI